MRVPGLAISINPVSCQENKEWTHAGAHHCTKDRQEHFWLLIRHKYASNHNSNTPPMHFWKLCRLDVLLTMGREVVKGKQRSVPLSQPTRPTGGASESCHRQILVSQSYSSRENILAGKTNGDEEEI